MRLLSTLVAGVAAGALLVGCTPGATESPSPAPSPTVTIQTPTPSPSPSTVSPTPSPTEFQSYPADLPTEDPVSAAIIEGWQEYQRVRTKYLSDPFGYTDLGETQQVTTGEQMESIIRAVEFYRENNIRSLGGVSFGGMSVGEIHDHGDELRESLLSYCVDRSRAEAETYDGAEFPTGNLIPRFQETALMVEGLDGIWRVALIRNSEDPC